jgi:hypothetical protein
MLPKLTSLKSLLAIASVVAVSALGAPSARAVSIGKLAGSYTGSGTITDSRNPSAINVFTFSDVQIKILANGKIDQKHSSAVVSVAVTEMGVTHPYPGSQTISAKGGITSIKKVGAKVTATGQILFDDGAAVVGTLTASVTGQNAKFKVNIDVDDVSASFVLKKK